MRNVVGNFNYMKAGVLAIQGSVVEHVRALERAGASEVIEVRTCDELAEVDCLVMPGGESTTISKLMKLEGLDKALAERNMPIFGTCAGAILLAQLGLFDAEVERNAYGRQLDSFEADVELPNEMIGVSPEAKRGFIVEDAHKARLLHAVFIRAPKILSVGAGVKILAKYKSDIILCRQGNILVSTFHPELTDDPRVHKYFLDFRPK